MCSRLFDCRQARGGQASPADDEPSLRRQHRHRLDLVERALAGERADLHHRAGRRRQVRIGEFGADLAQQRLVGAQVDQKLCDLDDVLEAAAGGGERASDVLPGLRRLRLEISGRANQVAVAVGEVVLILGALAYGV